MQLVRESEYTDFETDQNIYAALLYYKMIQMDEEIIEPTRGNEIYFKALFKKGVFEGVLRSAVIMNNKIVQWGRIRDVERKVTVSISNSINNQIK